VDENVLNPNYKGESKGKKPLVGIPGVKRESKESSLWRGLWGCFPAPLLFGVGKRKGEEGFKYF
jgi:hypothetical protein